MAETLTPLGPRAGGHRRRAEAALASVPLEAATYFGSEAVLDDPAAAPSFAYNLSEAGLRRLRREGTRIGRFCRRWNGESAAVWIEYELRGASRAQRRGVYFGLPRDAAEERVSYGALVQALSGRRLPAAVEANAVRLARTAPAEVRRIQVGVGLAGPDAVRLCLLGVRPRAVVPYLEEAGWPGREHAVAHLLDRYGQLADGIGLALDVAGDLLPTVGLELLFRRDDPRDWQPPGEVRWLSLFQGLVADGLCTPEIRDALLAWPGESAFGAPLVDRLIAASSGGAPLPGGVMVRGLQHVKLTLHGPTVRAKGYWGARVEQRVL